ncbi:DUF6042 family protein [Risungbinella massiliensis]|uniref:DUF6042 family protein n=1 Tax=Risungbinella massiliensis TaxID=1329796 RepID=UPI0005CC772E|nr:DUF6042 family protein [Risungbinella massiliensis]
MGFVVTLLTTTVIKEEHLRIPPDFFYNAWNLLLPQGTLSVLLSVMAYVRQGLDKEEIYEVMTEEADLLELHPFSFIATPAFQTPEEKHHYTQRLNRETEVRKVLELSGFRYPRNIQDSITLLIKFGILIEVELDQREKIYLDMILHPFPRPEEYLTLDEQKLEEIQYGRIYRWY